MGKGGSTPGISPGVQQGLLSNENALVQIAQQQSGNAEQLYKLTEPGLVTAENFYETLASGDPGAIMRAIAPTAQAASSAATGAKSNIMANAPPGGEKNLALEQVDVNRGAEIAKTASGASLAAPNALGQLAGQGVGESISASGAATGALSAGSSTLGSLGGLQLQGQQLQMEQKGQQLGVLGSAVGDIGSIASSQQGGKSALDAVAALAVA